MQEWNRADAEMAIALKRAELNRALSYKSKYDADKHNICLALIRFKDGTTDVLASYSNDSAIPESIRLGLNLIPNHYASMTDAERFGCDGMAQYHTEPKLLNYLCASPGIRQSAYHGPLPKDEFFKSVLHIQRQQAKAAAGKLRHPDDIAYVVLVTEIDCCPTCTKYSVERFRALHPHTKLDVIELGKKTSGAVPPQFKEVKVTHA